MSEQTSNNQEAAARLEPLVGLEFKTLDDAAEWMERQVDDSCVDNHRFAFLDDAAEMDKYKNAIEAGCCGFFDEEFVIAGRKATIGCNYGH